MHILSSEAGVGSWLATYTTTVHTQSFSLQKVSGQLECVYLSCPAALLPLLCLCYTPSFLSCLLLVQIDRSDSCPSSSRSPGPLFPFATPAGQFPSHPSIILFLSSPTMNHQSHTPTTTHIHPSIISAQLTTNTSIHHRRPACLPGSPRRRIHHP